jgi:hypothetical protein
MQALSILFTALAILQSSYAQCNLGKGYDVGTCGDDPQICHARGTTYGCPSTESCISGCGVFGSDDVLGSGAVAVSH